MNRIISLLIFCAVFGTAVLAHGAEVTDTALYMKNAGSVIVTENSSALTVTVNDTVTGNAETFHFPYEEGKKVKSTASYSLPWERVRSSKAQWNIITGGFGFGFVNACGSPSGCDVEMGKSFEFTIKNALAVGYSPKGMHDTFQAGIGMVWRNYRMTGDNRFFRMDDGSVAVGPYAPGLVPQGSRLKTFSLSFPVTWSHSFSRHLGFDVSVMLNANLYGSLKTKYRNAENIQTEEFTKVSDMVRKFSVDFMGTFRFCTSAALYIRYSPMKVLKTGAGPGFTPLSTGLLICY